MSCIMSRVMSIGMSTRMSVIMSGGAGFQGQAPEPIDDMIIQAYRCLLYTSDAADDLLCVDLGGRRVIQKKTTTNSDTHTSMHTTIIRHST